MKRYLPICIAVVVSGMLASCGTKQAIQKRYNTLDEKAQLTIAIDQHQYTMGCTIQAWHNDLVIISIQPLAGIEMFRMEATEDSLWVFDKMNRRYTVIAFPTLAGLVKPSPSLKLIEDYINGKATKNADSIEKTFTMGEHQLTLGCRITHREYNQLGKQNRILRTRYERVPLKQILPL